MYWKVILLLFRDGSKKYYIDVTDNYFDYVNYTKFKDYDKLVYYFKTYEEANEFYETGKFK